MRATRWYQRWTARRRAANRALTTAEAGEWLRSYLAFDASGSLSSAERYSLTERTGLEPLASSSPNAVYRSLDATPRENDPGYVSPAVVRASSGYVTAMTRLAEMEDNPYISPAVIRAARAYAASADLLGDPPSDPLVFGPEYRLPLNN